MNKRFSQFSLRAKTAWRLGLLNVFAVFIYRIGLKTGLHPVCFLNCTIQGSEFFLTQFGSLHRQDSRNQVEVKNAISKRKVLFFGRKEVPFEQLLGDWSVNTFTQMRSINRNVPWWKVSEFDPGQGDIKVIWEPSRMNWLLPMAQEAYREKAQNSDWTVQQMNALIGDWVKSNPCYFGPNWKCGQEAAIRVINVLVAVEIQGIWSEPNEAISGFIEAHLERIWHTRHYAIAQDNNHGSTEAAALYIGGLYLEEQARVRKVKTRKALKYLDLGWKTLSERADRLIMSDGTFSQYSTNYHRMVLDTYSVVEYFRLAKNGPELGVACVLKIRSAINWIEGMMDSATGRVPNLGANDGSQLLQVANADYLDYRPSLRLAKALFSKQSRGDIPLVLAFFRGEKDLSSISICTDLDKVRNFGECGFVVVRLGQMMVLLRSPNFRFRPSQSDGLHLDVWRGSCCLLGDAGTYSYNLDPSVHEYFSGTRSHNTIEFDDRSQMPRLSRFLLGAWLEGDGPQVEQMPNGFCISDGYTDYLGATHHRKVLILRETESENPSLVLVTDNIGGKFDKAVLRWRLPNHGDPINKFSVLGTSLETPMLKLKITASQPIERFEVVEGFESLYYLEKERIACLEIEFQRRVEGSQSITIETRIEFR